MFNQKDKERVLKYLLNHKRSVLRTIYNPENLFTSIPGIPANEFFDYLCVWESAGHISVVPNTGDIMRDGVLAIYLNDPAITYFSDKKVERQKDLLRWTMNLSIALASALAGAILARLSMLVWP